MITKFKPLKYGDKGAAVTKVQQLLRKVGSSIQVNGEYTIGMVSAVKSFQKKNGMKVTGVVDAKTMSKLEESAKPVRKKRTSKE